MPRTPVIAILLAALVSVLAPRCAFANTEVASLQASFSPDRLGAPTTIGFGFHLATAEGAAPPPLTYLDVHMPAGLDYTTTTLGLAICQPAVLLARGLAACPPNSRLGYGSASVEIPFGLGAGHEIPEIQALSGPSPHGNLLVLFYANGLTPVYAQLAFSGEVLPDAGLYGSQLATAVPLVPSVRGGPDVAIVSMHTTIGPSHLTYYRHVHGRLVPFHPRGIAVPARCPKGGFPFAAEFAFQDGNRTIAKTAVPCPAHVH